MTSIASGSTAARTLAARAADRVNVRDFGALGDGVSDDGPALNIAIAALNAKAAFGLPSILYLPSGQYRIATALTPFARGTAGGILGDGSHKSTLRVDASYSGDLFTWADAWDAATSNAGSTAIAVPGKIGPRVVGIGVYGDRTATAQQNAFTFYDHADFVFFSDVDVRYFPGRVVYAGVIKSDADAYMRESRFENVRIFNSGLAGAPCFELTSQATGTGGDATNEIDIANLAIYGPRGPGLVIRNAQSSAAKSIRTIRISKLRVEGTENNTYGVAADLVALGDAAMDGPVANVSITDSELVSPYTGYAALRLTGMTLTNAPYRITFSGMIIGGGGGGKGLSIDATRGGNRFTVSQLAAASTALTIGSSTLVGGPLWFDGGGQEVNWTTAIDASVLQFVRWPGGRWGALGSGSTTTGVSAQIADSTVTGGNARGANAVDHQTYRTSAAQAATGANATIGGGAANTASNTDATVAGGSANTAGGYRSAIPGGYNNTTANGAQYSVASGIYGLARTVASWAFGGGQFSGAGSAQAATYVLYNTGSGTAAMRLTGLAATASTTNVVNIPDNTAFGLNIRVAVRSVTTPANSYVWVVPAAILLRGTGVANTTLTLGTPTTLATGSFAPTVSVTADTTNGGLNITVTPPSGNTDTIHAVARVESVEVQ